MTDFVYIPKLRFPTPKIFTKLETYYYSFIIHFHLALDEILNFFGLNRFSYRDAKIHRTKLHLFLESRIVIDTEDQSDIQSVLKHSKKRLLRESLKRAKKSLGIFDRIFPLGFARLYIYKSDHRRRKLRNFGLGEDLICTIQVRKLKEVNLPDIMNSTIELSGKYRIAWNKKWLASRKS